LTGVADVLLELVEYHYVGRALAIRARDVVDLTIVRIGWVEFIVLANRLANRECDLVALTTHGARIDYVRQRETVEPVPIAVHCLYDVVGQPLDVHQILIVSQIDRILESAILKSVLDPISIWIHRYSVRFRCVGERDGSDG